MNKNAHTALRDDGSRTLELSKTFDFKGFFRGVCRYGAVSALLAGNRRPGWLFLSTLAES